tara:strand:- start:323 stop:1402 length:1080 start_codon:yes stop_codon:yes gene_type:complete
MAVPSSGAISLAGLKAEVDTNTYNASATTATSLFTIATETTFNSDSTSTPNSSAPHGMEEWYGYDHDATASWSDDYAISKSITTGIGQAIYFDTPADSASHFIQTDAFTINIWVKAGWSSSNNSSIFLWDSAPLDHSSNWDNRMMLRYRESNNRMYLQIQNNNSGNKDIQSEWLFHSNSGAYAAAYSASGLGSTYWSASNRGNVNSNNFTMITITKSTTAASSGVTLYWNGVSCGAPPINADTSPGSLGMHDDDTKRWTIGSNLQHFNEPSGNSYYRAGDTSESEFNDFAVWNAELDADNVAALYNSGTPFDVTSSNGDYDSESDLVLYYAFENTTSKTGGSDSGGTLTVAGNSNFSSL